jgi:hypothetical protein
LEWLSSTIFGVVNFFLVGHIDPSLDPGPVFSSTEHSVFVYLDVIVAIVAIELAGSRDQGLPVRSGDIGFS